MHVALLGKLRLTLAEKPFRFVARPKTVPLLAYLLLHREAASSRDTLAFLLWPDETEEVARSNLRRHLHNLREALPPSDVPWLLVEGDSVQWNDAAGAGIDVVEFERLAGAEDVRSVELYAGDLLEELYDDWLQPHRERLRALYVETLWKLATKARERREPEAAGSLLQRMLTTDPWREDALRALMSVCYERGDRAGALSLFDAFERRLQAELGVKPMPESVALHEAIVHNVPPPKLPVPNNLPLPTSSFVGRDEDVARLVGLVAAHRLVTVVGTGGVGKTRTAIRVASELLEDYPDGVWLAELAPIGNGSLLVETLAAAVGVQESSERPILDTLQDYLRKRRTLIVLDNCEHVVAEAATTAEAILRAAPSLHLLATSRENLRIADETVYRLPSLSFPSADDELTANSAALYGAVTLFVDRATAVDPAFRLTDETASIVGDICRRLDGIALAIELAAARIKILSVKSLAGHLSQRFRVLSGGSRTALPRQQTLHALIDWSYELLSEPERRLLCRAAIFAGSWTLESAQAVCGEGPDEQMDPIETLDLHTSLVEKSLVVVESSGERSRFRLLESTRAYGLEKLDADERMRLARRHATWMAGFADRAYELLVTMQNKDWLALVEPDFENARAAMTWALGEAGDPVLAARIASGLSRLWARGLQGEGRRWIEATLARLTPDAPLEIQARTWRALAGLLVAKRTAEAAERAIELFSRLGASAELADSYRLLSSGLYDMRRLPEAESAIERALTLFRELGQTKTRRYGASLQQRAVIAAALRRFDEASSIFGEAFSLYEKIGDEANAALTALRFAELEFARGESRRALDLANEAITVSSRLRESALHANALSNLAAYRVALGDVDGARVAGQDGLGLALRSQYARVIPFAILHLATVAAHSEDPRRAARLVGYVDAWYRREGGEAEFTEQKSHDSAMAAIREQLAPDEIDSLLGQGSQLSEDEATAEARGVGPAPKRRPAEFALAARRSSAT